MSLIAISGHLKDPLGNPLVGATVTFRLVNFTSMPMATGSNLVVPIVTTLLTDVNGLFSGNIQGNDTITPANTFYQVNFSAGPLASYSFVGSGPISLDSYATLAGNIAPLIGLIPTSLLMGSNIFTGPNTFTGNNTHSGLETFKSINTVLYAAQFSGSDIGAQVNSAIAALPTTSDGSVSGTIVLPAGTFSYSTPIMLPASHGHDAVYLQGSCGGGGGAGSGFPGISQGGTVLNYTGSGIGIQQLAGASNQNDLVGGLSCLIVDGTSGGAGAVGIEFGGVQNFSLNQVSVSNFSGAGSVGIRIHNSAAAQFTERYSLSGVSLTNNTTGLLFKREAGANASFSHALGSLQLQINSGQTGVSIIGGGTLANSNLVINGNCGGAGTVLSIDATSAMQNDFLFFGLENDGTCVRFSVASGGILSVFGQANNVGAFTDSGIFQFSGMSVAANGGLVVGGSGTGVTTLTTKPGTATNVTLNSPTTTGEIVVDVAPQTLLKKVLGDSLTAGGAISLAGTGACTTLSGVNGGAWSGGATCTGTTGAATLTITPGTTAPHAWICFGSDITTGHLLNAIQSGVSVTSCTLSFTSVTNGDVVSIAAIAF